MDLDHINYELNIQKSNLLLLKEYLNKMNNLIQEDDSYDNSFKFMEMLKELKVNMDNTKSNISNLTVLRTLLLNLQVNSENGSNEQSEEKSDEEIKLDLTEDSSIKPVTENTDINSVEEKTKIDNLEEDTFKEVIYENATSYNQYNKFNKYKKNKKHKKNNKYNKYNKYNIKPVEEVNINSSNNSNIEVSSENKEEVKKESKENIKGITIQEQDSKSILDSDEEKKTDFYEEANKDLSEENLENSAKAESENNSEVIKENKSQEQIVAKYYEECFENLEKNFVVFYAFLLNYINSCELSEDYYLSELSKEKQYAIEFIQNELMEKEENSEEETEPKQEKHFTDARPVIDENPFIKNIDKVEIQEEVVIANNSNNENTKDDNNIGTLIISEKENKVILPYTEDDIKKILDETTEYTSLEQIIDDKYTIPLDRYKNPALSRFRETYNLMKKRQKASMADSLDLALELSFNSSLNPAIITACKNLEQLDSYLTCAELNEIDKFEYFKIKYEILPMKK